MVSAFSQQREHLIPLAPYVGGMDSCRDSFVTRGGGYHVSLEGHLSYLWERP